MKRIVHIDLNAFFIQVESILNPKLNEIPAAVGHDSRRSVIATSNYLARKYGVNSGDPINVAKNKCKELIIVEPHYYLYKKYSDEFFHVLKSKTKLVEIASIDEAYLDLTDYINGDDGFNVSFACNRQGRYT